MDEEFKAHGATGTTCQSHEIVRCALLHVERFIAWRWVKRNAGAGEATTARTEHGEERDHCMATLGCCHQSTHSTQEDDRVVEVHLQCVLHVLIDFHYSRQVTAAIAVVWRTKNGDNSVSVGPLVALQLYARGTSCTRMKCTVNDSPSRLQPLRFLCIAHTSCCYCCCCCCCCCCCYCSAVQWA